MQTLTLMLVEDNRVNQMLATTLLERWGHTVVLAENGQQAVDLYSSRHWDLILMDLQMPVMDGLQATSLIRAQEGDALRTPIIAVTANAQDADRKACLEAGMDAFLPKPLNPATLKAMLASHAKPAR